MSEFSDKVKLQQIKNTFSSVGEKIEKDNNEQKANSKKTPNWNKNKNKKNKNKKNKNKNKQKNVEPTEEQQQIVEDKKTEQLKNMFPGTMEKVEDVNVPVETKLKNLKPNEVLDIAKKTGNYKLYYESTGGKVPGSFASRVDVPQEVNKIGLRDEYIRAVYRKSIGLPPEPAPKFKPSEGIYFETKGVDRFTYFYNRKTIWNPTWVKNKAVFTDDKDNKITWKDMEKQYGPGLQLKKSDDNKSLVPYINYSYGLTQLNKEYDKKNPFANVLRKGSFSLLNVFDLNVPGKILAGEDARGYLRQKDYQSQMAIRKGKGFETWATLQAPAYTNVILPLAGGAVFGKAMSWAGSVSAGKVAFTGSAKAVSWATKWMPRLSYIPRGAGYVGLGAYGVGETYRVYNAFQESKGKGYTALMEAGTRTTLGFVGARYGANWKPTTSIGKGPKGEMVLQRSITSFRGKPFLKYGEPVTISKTGTVTKIIGSNPYKNLSFRTIKSFMNKPKTPTYKWNTGIKAEQIGYQPKGLVKYPNINKIPSVGKPNTVVATWGNKSFVTMVGAKGWQPKINTSLVVRPSTKVGFSRLNAKSIIPKDVMQTLSLVNYKKWQPKTGLEKPVSEINNLDELFKVYRDNKITTRQYQNIRDKIKLDTKPSSTKPTGLEKPPVRIVKTPRVTKINVSAKDGLIFSKMFGKTYVETGKGWQKRYQSKNTSLSTKVWPKPKLYRSYETYYRFIVYTKPLYTITKKPSYIKPKGKTYTLKDVVKETNIKDTDFGITDTKTGTVTIQKTQTIQKTKLKTLTKQEVNTISETKTDTLKIPESLLKPIYKREYMKMTKQDSILLKKIQSKQAFAIKPKQQTKSITLLGTNLKMDQSQISNQQMKLGSQTLIANMLKTDTTQKQMPDTSQAQIIIPAQDIVTPTITVTTPKPVITTPPIPPDIPNFEPPFKPPPPKKKRKKYPDDDTTNFFGRKEDVDNFQGGYVVKVKPRQYKDGKYLGKKEYNKPLNKKPLSYQDAINLGQKYVGRNEKASFKIEKTSGKPRKQKTMLLGGNNGYYEKQPGVFVEKNKYRINSPGEIQNISMKGVRASRNTPKNTKPKTKTVKIKDKKINNKIKKFMKGGFI